MSTVQLFFDSIAMYWRDCLEILLFSTTIYYYLIWLKKDNQKNLSLAFYAYCTILCISYYAQLATIHYIMLTFTPIALILFIVLHQETLQKNFVLLKKAKLPQEANYWIDDLMRGCLAALNNNKEIVIAIEQNDNLKNLITAPCLFYADLKKDIFDMLIEKHTAGNDLMIWVNQDGKLVAINACWKIHADEEWITMEAQNIHKWKQDSIYVTSKTDAIVLKINPLTRTFDLVMLGKIAEEISSDQAFTILQRNLATLKQANRVAKENQASKEFIIHATKQSNDFEKEYN